MRSPEVSPADTLAEHRDTVPFLIILYNGDGEIDFIECFNNDAQVTDQEGFWTPKNRINRVKPGGFYGNMFGYTNVTDTSDAAMEQPMVWITNGKDRSPAELLWVPKTAWGTLGGSLLNLSYGTGRVFIVPHEQNGDQWQGAVCELPMPAFPTGVMRGRFGTDGALYTCGLDRVMHGTILDLPPTRGHP